MRKRRPALVTWLSLGVLILAAVFWAGFVGGLSLPDLPFAVPIAYLLLRNAAWGTWGLLAALSAFFGKPWAPRLISWGGAVTVLWYWVDRLLLTRSDYARSSAPLAAVLTLAAVGALAIVLRRPSVRRYFQESGP